MLRLLSESSISSCICCCFLLKKRQKSQPHDCWMLQPVINTGQLPSTWNTFVILSSSDEVFSALNCDPEAIDYSLCCKKSPHKCPKYLKANLYAQKHPLYDCNFGVMLCSSSSSIQRSRSGAVRTRVVMAKQTAECWQPGRRCHLSIPERMAV